MESERDKLLRRISALANQARRTDNPHERKAFIGAARKLAVKYIKRHVIGRDE